MREQTRHPAAQAGHQRLIPFAAISILLIGVGLLILGLRGGDQIATSSPAAAALASASGTSQAQASDQILEATKALGLTQQQAVDQLQVVQDLLAAQQAEVKRLAEQVAVLTSKIDGLQPLEAAAPAVPSATASKLTSNSRR